uniref:RNA helicase n=1 Tax=Odontella aurita TaxID=265563 RepID=A0A7S4JE29_9STRA|mmetsp:Transcript_44685/g.136331  ORF Transcript_44685/g.136331 Transcript_44685/m.136331 type:complete len:623 (+) Transcript_44685:126-1994(+)
MTPGRGGGRQGRGGGRGRGRGGRGSSVGGRGGGDSSPRHGRSPEGGESSRERLKDRRRQRQSVAVQRKADAEAEYFRQCQSEEIQRSRNQPRRGRPEAELFSKQVSAGINFDRYDRIDVELKGPGSDEVPPLVAFSDLGPKLPGFLSKNVGLMGYESPTPIQKYAVPLALAGRDLMCCAQTGSGKTCAFLLPIVSHLGGNHGSTAPPPQVRVGDPAFPRCVVMAPTRELAAQIQLEAEKLCHNSTIRPVVVYGGADQRKQVRELAHGADIVVATPGRLTDFIDRGIVSMSYVAFLVLDEADRMLDMGFEPQIRRIVEKADMPSKEHRQTLLFSATFAPEIQKLAAAFLRPYVWIAVGRVGSTVENIEQRLVQSTSEKRKKLRLVVKALAEKEGRTLVFVQKKRTATWIKNQLRRGGPADGSPEERFPPVLAEDIHGDRSQSQREAALRKFREGTVRVLVATDVAARGLDIGGVEHVINMDLPCAKDEFDSYVHRIGRTGRAGHMGLATSLYVPGNEPKTGNASIAKSLMAQMRETGSDIPDWFAALPECGGGGWEKDGGKKKKFGGLDVRDASSGEQGQGEGPSRVVSSRSGRGDSRGGSSRRGRGGRGRGKGRGGVETKSK